MRVKVFRKWHPADDTPGCSPWGVHQGDEPIGGGFATQAEAFEAARFAAMMAVIFGPGGQP